MPRQPIEILHLGLSQNCPIEGHVTHFPIITTEPLPLPNIPDNATHILYTSKETVRYFPPHLPNVAIGPATAAALSHFKLPTQIASEATAEGIIELLNNIDIPFLLYPHSKLARPIIREFLERSGKPFFSFSLYTTQTQKPGPLPRIDEYDLVYFTSPSTVDAFINLFGKLPPVEKQLAIGPVTQRRLETVGDSW